MKKLFILLSLVLIAGCATQTKRENTQNVDSVTKEGLVVPSVSISNEAYGPFPVEGEKKEAALILSVGMGGFHAFSGIGVFSALQEEKIKVSQLEGFEYGALVAGIIATSRNQNEIDWKLLSIKNEWFDEKKGIRKLFQGKSAKQQIKIFIEKLFGEKTFSETVIPLRIVAICKNRSTGRDEALVIQQGKIKEAVLASLSQAAFFDSVLFQGNECSVGELVSLSHKPPTAEEKIIYVRSVPGYHAQDVLIPASPNTTVVDVDLKEFQIEDPHGRAAAIYNGKKAMKSKLLEVKNQPTGVNPS